MEHEQESTARVTFELNPAQQQVVEATKGPVLVVAGAGTGKTRVLVERIIGLINSGVSPESILALTFTEKAAAEMLDRLNESRGSVTLDATVATFNGFGNDLLKAYGSEWGLGAIKLLGETGQLVFMREHLDAFKLDYFAPVSQPDSQLSLLARYVSLLKQQLVKSTDYQEFADKLQATDTASKLDKHKHQELARFYQKYLELCRTNQLIDYDDQLYLTLEMLTARPNILRILQDRYQYVLVDEFQDTNPMQSALVDLLAAHHHNVMVVGDDDQSIYGWRGATLANILDFKKRYTHAREITLIENYRSTQAILDSAYRLIQHNNPHRLEAMNNLDKRLRSQIAGGTVPTVNHFTTLEAELTWIAEDIARRLLSGQEARNIAVLARRNQGVQKVHEALELQDIPHAVAGLSNNMYDQTAVKQLVEALKTIADPLDDMSLFHTLSGPLFELDSTEVAHLAAASKRTHGQLIEEVASAKDPKIKEAVEQISSWRQASTDLSVGQLAYRLIDETGWKNRLYDLAEHDVSLFVQVQALSKYFKSLKEFESVADVASVQNYVRNLPALKAAGSGFEDASLDVSDTLVNVLSVHRAKGLEWDTVYIVDCSEGSFPMRSFGGGLTVPTELQQSPTEADEHMAEERRLMYVAVTRARKELILSHSDRHGTGAVRKPSRFLNELVGYQSTHSPTGENQQTNLELFAPRRDSALVGLPSEMKNKNGLLVLSVSQIDCWLRCPQDFYYRYVLSMPLPPTPALQYGTLIHGVIEQIHQTRRRGQTPQLEPILKHVKANLPMVGYISAGSRDRAHAQALKTVASIFERFSTAELPVEAEKPFAVEIPDTNLIITGRIDAIYKHDKSVEIRDFKTGTSVKTPEKAKQRATGSNQLALYALAWRLLHDEMPALLSLDFVETGQVGFVKKQAKSLDTLSLKLEQMTKDLLSSNYPPGKDHAYCDHPL